ncbi:hypothetical protein C8R43DRAFT_873913 [Mycena crocata]|nr:hypothetical protein C8R43DRAFT_873913 [Mycena crocata]
MCYRTFPCTVHACGHEIPIGHTKVGENIYCGSRTCRFSTSHPSSCPQCARTCKRW